MVSKHELGSDVGDSDQAGSDSPEGMDTVGAGARSAAGEAQKAKWRAYYAANRERVKKRMRDYYRAHRGWILERMRLKYQERTK